MISKYFTCAVIILTVLQMAEARGVPRGNYDGPVHDVISMTKSVPPTPTGRGSSCSGKSLLGPARNLHQSGFSLSGNHCSILFVFCDYSEVVFLYICVILHIRTHKNHNITKGIFWAELIKVNLEKWNLGCGISVEDFGGLWVQISGTQNFPCLILKCSGV